MYANPQSACISAYQLPCMFFFNIFSVLCTKQSVTNNNNDYNLNNNVFL